MNLTELPTPKEVNEFARKYEQMWLALVQCESTLKYIKMNDVQIKFDELVKEYGAEAVIAAIKGHVHPDSGGTCPQTPCPKGYYCSGGSCVLDVG